MKSEVYNQSNFLILKAAYLYYLEEKSQSEIAAMLNISVPTVSRLIKRAVKDKLVEFVIRDLYIECIKLEQQVKQAFDLKDVIIAPSPYLKDEEKVKSTENMKKLVALEGARYIQRIITENDVLGISWGKTMYHLIHYLNPCQKVNAAFVTLHGSVSSIESELDVRTLVSRIAMTFGGKNYSLLMEGLMSNAEIVNSIKQEKNVKKVFEIFDRLTISVCGIGSFYPQVESALSKSEYLCGSELTKLKNKNVAADLALRFIDLDGNECDTDLKDRTLSIDLDKFRKVKTKITVAAGQSKANSVLAVLKGKLVDVLITDYTLGKELLKG